MFNNYSKINNSNHILNKKHTNILAISLDKKRQVFGSDFENNLIILCSNYKE